VVFTKLKSVPEMIFTKFKSNQFLRQYSKSSNPSHLLRWGLTKLMAVFSKLKSQSTPETVFTKLKSQEVVFTKLKSKLLRSPSQK
jgi:hypothetical protein